MSDREELEALRRLAELEAKAGGAQPALFNREKPWNPTDDMGTGERLLAGTGKAFHDLYMGAKQALNIGDQAKLQEQIDEHKRLGQPLMNTGAGAAGNVLGNVATLAPAAFIPGVNTIAGGAALGAASGALQPTATDESAAAQMIGGAMIGGASSALTNALPSVARGAISPFFERGRRSIAADVLRRFGGEAPLVINPARTQGWQATLAEATSNPGIATLERGAASKSPELAAAIYQRQLSQNQAVADALGRIVGTPQQQQAARAARETIAGGLYKQAADEGLAGPGGEFGAAWPEMQKQIAKFLKRPSMQKAVAKAKEIFREGDIDFSEQGSVRGLQLLKQSLDDIIEKAPTSSIGKNELRELQGTRSDLIGMIQTLSPTQRLADEQYALLSRPINEQKIAQYLADKLQPAITDFQPGAPTRLTPNAFAAALRDKDEIARKASGYAGARWDTAMSQGAKEAIEGIGTDIARRSAIQEAARGVGSNTAQNLASQQLLARLVGPIGMPQSWADAVASSTIGQSLMRPAQWVGKIAEQGIQEQLSRALLDPAYAQQLLANASPTIQNAMLRRGLLNAPTIGAIGLANWLANGGQ